MKARINIINNLKNLQMKPFDFILIFVLMVVSFLPLLLLFNQQKPTHSAQLRVKGHLVKTFDLRKNQTFTYIDKEDDDFNKIEVKDGKIAIVDANCDDQICIRKGFISKSGQTIVCLPHQLVIEIMGNHNKKDTNRIVDYS